MKVSPNVILRVNQDGNGGLLYHVIKGRIIAVNASGVWLWQQLAREKTFSELTALATAAAGESELVRVQIDEFIDKLAAEKFVLEYDGTRSNVELPESEDYPLYDLASMLRVFTPGDALILEDVDFATIQAGDVVAFHPQGFDAPGVVHRVIARTMEHLTTMGDNNPAADLRKLTADDFPQLVTAKINANHQRILIARGPAGMRQFYTNRILRFFRRIIGRICRNHMPKTG